MAAIPANLLFLEYNNYFNRIIKKENTVNDYQSGRHYVTDVTVNFNPNDGITTSVITGRGLARTNLEKMDYCVVYDQVSRNILSRWFITEKVQTRSNQFEFFLRRDVIADNIQNVLSAKTFIEKGQIAATDTLRKPLIYNKESMTYNEIKSGETLLRDETKIPWIVGYIASNAVSASGASVDSTSTLGSTGTVNTNWNTYKLNVVCEKITLENTTIGSDPITAKPYSSGIENFEASYDPSTGMVHYAINLPGWANQNIKLVMYIVEPLPISADLTYPIEGAIESSSLPWTFDPNATNLSGLNKYRITPAILNVIGNNEYYRMVWPVTDFVPTSPTTYTKSTLVAKGNKTSWPSFDPTTIWWMYTSHTNAGDGDWNTYGSDSILEANVPVLLPNVIVNNLRENGYSLTGDGLSVPDAYQYNNAIIHHGTKYYRLNVQPKTTSSVTISEAHSDRAIFSSFGTACATSASGYNAAATGSIITLNSHTPSVAATVDYSAELDSYALTITEISNSATIDTEIAPDVNRCHLLDAPYDMFAIPYDAITVTKTNAAFTPFQADKDVSMGIALEMSKDISTSKLYDIQLLPYCPCRYMINSNGQIDLSRGQEGINYDFITETVNGMTSNKSVILWASRSSDTFDINQSVSMPTEDTDASLNIKINNECSKYRLVSPNFNGMFEFSVAKNGGSVSKFNVDYTYKPFSPYIHINPDFQGLYGSDYDDTRGLILGGDFSLPMINDAWVQYQVQNKNYQEIFDRQIQHMDVNNSIALDKQSFSSLMGTIGGITGGGISGAVGGAKTGGPYGAAAGAALGAIGGAVAGIIGGEMDRGFMYREQEEARSYATDMYGFSLGNIQATPYSLAKSSALTNNNKLFPIVEYYTCTTVEKQALKEKLIADGMSIMTIDQISNFIRNDMDLSFIRGSVVRLDTLTDDSHLANEIYKEIKKGVYFTPNVGV